MGSRPNQANKARWARAKTSPVLVRPGRCKTDKAGLPQTKLHPRKRIHVRKTRLLWTLAKQGAHFGPLTNTSEISGKPNILLTYKNGYSDTPQESRTMNTREYERRRNPRPSPIVFSRLKRDRSRSPKPKEKGGGVFKRLGSRGRSVSARSDSHNQLSYSKSTYAFSESEDSGGGHWKSRSRKKKPSEEEDNLS
ncbi:hypothetical protein Tco_0184794 [Tanacetum coccineum]